MAGILDNFIGEYMTKLCVFTKNYQNKYLVVYGDEIHIWTPGVMWEHRKSFVSPDSPENRKYWAAAFAETLEEQGYMVTEGLK
jgi:hypothetical protein